MTEIEEVGVNLPTTTAPRSYNDLLAERAALRGEVQLIEAQILALPTLKPFEAPRRVAEVKAKRKRLASEKQAYVTRLQEIKAELVARQEEADNAAPVEWEYRRAAKSLNPAELKVAIAAQQVLIGQIENIRRREILYLKELLAQADRVGQWVADDDRPAE